MADDELIVPGQPPRRRAGIREVLDVTPGKAATIRIAEGGLLVYNDLALHFTVPGDYIVMPLVTWEQTLARAVRAATDETDAQVTSRQVRRALARDRKN